MHFSPHHRTHNLIGNVSTVSLYPPHFTQSVWWYWNIQMVQWPMQSNEIHITLHGSVKLGDQRWSRALAHVAQLFGIFSAYSPVWFWSWNWPVLSRFHFLSLEGVLGVAAAFAACSANFVSINILVPWHHSMRIVQAGLDFSNWAPCYVHHCSVLTRSRLKNLTAMAIQN